MKISKIKTLSSTLVLLLLLSACSDSSDKKVSNEPTYNIPKIEIVQNSAPYAIKVPEKERDSSQSKSYYYDYNVDSNSSEISKSTKRDLEPRSSIEANIHVRTPYEKVEISMLVKRLSKNFILKCSACHNDYANGIIGPSLLEKDSDFIYKKIVAFKSGKESNPLMNDLVKMMDDREIKKISQEISEFNKEITQMRKR